MAADLSCVRVHRGHGVSHAPRSTISPNHPLRRLQQRKGLLQAPVQAKAVTEEDVQSAADAGCSLPKRQASKAATADPSKPAHPKRSAAGNKNFPPDRAASKGKTTGKRLRLCKSHLINLLDAA